MIEGAKSAVANIIFAGEYINFQPLNQLATKLKLYF